MKDPIDSRQLQIFVALARKGSLRGAAAELFLTNSAISHSIHALETSLDAKLFHRPGKFLELTDKGQLLLKEAPLILSSMDRVRLKLAGDVVQSNYTLRVAVGYSLINHFMPEVISEWEQCFPESRLVVRAAERDNCLRWIEDDTVDAALLVDPPAGSDFRVEPLFDDELRVVMGAASPLARLEAVTLRNLHGRTLLTSRLQSHTAQMILAEMRRHGFAFHDCIELGGIDGILEMVLLSNGITLQPNWTIDRRLNEKSLVSRPLSNVRLVRHWAHLSAGNKEMNVQERTFLRLCRRLGGTLHWNVAA